ncbi:DUF4349 domain-containing protein [Hymenobacter sediminis]|uniref:DUF4349 domain-containing protein n=1 Tax=Hymenobacter sediminis TaxID=2218621 RepID=UPI000DA6A363|nr:DUF4349 domain-containing protein [Hymenobacter sediminis]RPD48522.1 DUF4349 domain-containing protein [Hymenobacter sediminis]
MKIALCNVIVAASLLLSACSKSAENIKQEPATEDGALAAIEGPPAPEAPAPPEAQEPGLPTRGTVITAAPTAARKLIYHAHVRVKVENLVKTNARVDSLAHAYGAYISDASEEREEGQWEHKMTIRVLPGQFQKLLNSLNGLGVLESKTLSTDDVTAEHADVSARLRTKRAVEQRYVALLSQAKKITDILAIEEKIGEVREQIESTESRLKTLNYQIGYSTITLTYFQTLPLAQPDAPVLSFASRFTQAVYTGWGLLTGLVLAVVTAWPLFLLGALGLVAVRAWRRWRRTQLQAKA